MRTAGWRSMPRQRQRGCSSARAVGFRLWSAAAAIAARFIVPKTAPSEPGAARFSVPDSATKMDHRGDAATPLDKAATGRAIKK
ncbi:MAG: hypothetical protein QOD93_5158 [Acetobacteraceae bacterium]|nr:hypothetical protein [Acetobacteraceae bacterium]